MRTRDWRRHIEECIVIKRLKHSLSGGYWFRFKSASGLHVSHPMWFDLIGLHEQHKFKTYVTTKNDTKHKMKYSPNKAKGYWRDRNKKGNREDSKVELKRMLEKEYGIKHYYTEY